MLRIDKSFHLKMATSRVETLETGHILNVPYRRHCKPTRYRPHQEAGSKRTDTTDLNRKKGIQYVMLRPTANYTVR